LPFWFVVQVCRFGLPFWFAILVCCAGFAVLVLLFWVAALACILPFVSSGSLPARLSEPP
jgi:hypothetical protein